MSLAFFVLSHAVAGWAVAARLFRTSLPEADDRDTIALERASAAALLALAFAMTTSWVLAWAGLLRASWLLVASLPWFAFGVGPTLRSVRRGQGPPPGRGWWLPLASLLPVAMWVGAVLWRGAIVPPYNHDALAYHLPRAAMFVQEGRFAIPDVPEARLASWPCDYELLLADTMLLAKSDHFCAWIGTASFAAFLLLSATLAAKWWGAGRHVLVVVVATAATPIAILHSGLHKNDLMVCALGLAVAMWGADWARRGSFRALGLSYLALSLILGTKPTGAFFLVPALPLLAMGSWRRRSALRARWARACLVCGAAVLASTALLGGGVYVADLLRFHRVILPPEQPGVGYGAWAQLLVYPYLVLVSPFSDSSATWVPWAPTGWWLPHNDVWFSHFGVLFTVLAVTLPLAAYRYRREGRPGERLLAGAYLAFVTTLILLVKVSPFGLVSSYSRYFVYLVPLLAAATLSPMLLEIERRSRRGAVASSIASVAAVALFVPNAISYGLCDGYAPLSWVAYVLHNPEDRRAFIRNNRAADALDRKAGAGDHVAIDVGFDTWIYAAYGEDWTRRVEFLPRATGAVPVPGDADWVVVDRSWNVFFGNPGFTDVGHSDLLGKGAATASDRKVFLQLKGDPDFELVYVDEPQNQAVFRRRREGGGG